MTIQDEDRVLNPDIQEPHVRSAADLLNSYYLSVPIDSWATSDLIALVDLIDTELQQRAYEQEVTSYENQESA
jgi:hypothetical protein